MTAHSPITKLRRRRGLFRLIQVGWRDTRALLQEFRWSLIIFLLATVGLGVIYGELMVVAGHQRLPWYELPYIMFALMILEAPTDIPQEPYLLIFWYSLPLIALFIVGRGVADFARLFFDRSGRRTAWQEALVSTMRHHTIVLGIGHVGLKVTQALVDMGFEVVAVDIGTTPEKEAALNALDIPLILGDGRSAATLEKANLAEADALLICTSQDTVNLEMVLRARDLNPHIRIVARMGDTQFADQMRNFLGVADVLSSADIAAPLFAAATVGIEVTQTLTIHNRQYAMLRLNVAKGSAFDGRTIGSVQDRYDVDIVLHAQNDSAAEVHPDNDIVIAPGDTLVIFANQDMIKDLTRLNRPARTR
jgi:Trk K+ transport system NAD-binding subunit